MNMRIQHWTPEALRRAADIIEEVRKLNNEFDSILVGSTQPEPATSFEVPFPSDSMLPLPLPKRRRKMSAEARAKISAAAKKRWKKAWAAGRTSL